MSASSSVTAPKKVVFEITNAFKPDDRCYICYKHFGENTANVVGHAALNSAPQLTCFLHRRCCVKMLMEMLKNNLHNPRCGHCMTDATPPPMTSEEKVQWEAALRTNDVATIEILFPEAMNAVHRRRSIVQLTIAVGAFIGAGILVGTARYVIGSEILCENPIADTLVVVIIVATWSLALSGFRANVMRMRENPNLLWI